MFWKVRNCICRIWNAMCFLEVKWVLCSVDLIRSTVSEGRKNRNFQQRKRRRKTNKTCSKHYGKGKAYRTNTVVFVSCSAVWIRISVLCLDNSLRTRKAFRFSVESPERASACLDRVRLCEWRIAAAGFLVVQICGPAQVWVKWWSWSNSYAFRRVRLWYGWVCKEQRVQVIGK